MAKSTTSKETRNSKPDKPYEGFPLFPHATGRWAKKIRGKLHFFGRWGNSVAGEVLAVEDVSASSAVALEEFNRQWPHLSEGRTAPPSGVNGCQIQHLCNAFLTAKLSQRATGELSHYTFNEYQNTTRIVATFFGGDRLVDDLGHADFAALRVAMARGCNMVTLKSKINRARVLFKFASDTDFIDRPVAYGKAFNRPSEKSLRRAKNEAGENLFEKNDLLRILDALDGKPVAIEGPNKSVQTPRSPAMKAMVLLGLNAGFGNTDVASVPRSALHLETGWIVYPRTKTEIKRRVPLWPETIEAIRESLTERPVPKDEADADLCFITSLGTRFVRMQPSGTEDKFVTINPLSRRFRRMLDRLEINGRQGLGFYTLRHVFETQAGESTDQVAVDAIMGHVDPSMGAMYREKISDKRLRAVVETVRTWLFETAANSE